MKLTKSKLKQIIKEELEKLEKALSERGFGEGEPAKDEFSKKREVYLEEEEDEEPISEKSVSKSQQRFFGMVRGCQEEGDCPSDKVSKTAAEMGESDVKDFAKTKHKGLPEKKKKK